MKRILLPVLAVLMISSLATAQTTKIIVGPRDGNHAGVISVEFSEAISVDIWIRTAPGIKIIGLHLPLATKDEFIQSASRDSGRVFYPLPLWDIVTFLTPGPDFENEGYTNQSVLAIKDFSPEEDPDTNYAINTNGEWWSILRFEMTTAESDYHYPIDDAFMMGRHPDNGYMVWVDFETGEMNNDEIEVDYATLEIGMRMGIDDVTGLPTSYSLAQNYPNPFNASTTINYSLPEEGFVTIDIYDIMGRKIETLVSSDQNAGQYSVVWNANNVASGVYLYKINAGNYSETRRCNLLK